MLKYTFLFCCVLLLSTTAYSTIITLNNNSSGGGQYSDLQTAVNAANAYDTIYIHRSLTSYGNIELTKPLILIGEGVYPQKSPNASSLIGTLKLTYLSGGGNASKSRMSGLNITTLQLTEKYASATIGIDSIEAKYCKISTITLTTLHKELVLINNVIGSINLGRLESCKFYNNIINQLSVATTGGSNNLAANNIFLYRFNFYGGVAVNNIFYNTATQFVFSVFNTQFVNNLVYGTSSTPANTFTLNNNSSFNNIMNTDPSFVYPVAFNTILNYTYTTPSSGPYADFHLQSSSVAKNYGTDGLDLGIYGGIYPWVDATSGDASIKYFGMTRGIPHITSLTIPTPVVNSGGTLQIQLNATTQP